MKQGKWGGDGCNATDFGYHGERLSPRRPQHYSPQLLERVFNAIEGTVKALAEGEQFHALMSQQHMAPYQWQAGELLKALYAESPEQRITANVQSIIMLDQFFERAKKGMQPAKWQLLDKEMSSPQETLKYAAQLLVGEVAALNNADWLILKSIAESRGQSKS